MVEIIIKDPKQKLTPSVNEEWNNEQDHANDLPPVSLVHKKSIYKVTKEDIEKSRRLDKGSTQAGHIGESLDEE